MYAIRCRLCFFSAECRLCFLLEAECRLCFLSSRDGSADVSLPIATVTPGSDGWMMSAHPSQLGSTVATDSFCSSLL
jgi:hypothetical protein